ncbi:MAG: intradiol ring-cleavage dioxygenase, partial [Solirubrobacterales bacterium]|nr:intradiol ring-cleavage dioxygenase [Solirubrobacterales bacterium]
GAGAAWAALCGPGAIADALAATRATAASCVVLDPEVTAGPYWIANHLTRRNIAGGLAGLPLRLQFTVENVSTCKPITGADVEIWHANAVGVYSGFGAGAGSRTFLRGHQKADAHGRVLFDTIYPGWYRGRTPHIHLKVHVGGNVVHTGQVFFPDRTSDAVYRSSAYKSHGQPDTTNARDMIYAQAGGSTALVHLTRRGRGYLGRNTLGVKT